MWVNKKQLQTDRTNWVQRTVPASLLAMATMMRRRRTWQLSFIGSPQQNIKWIILSRCDVITWLPCGLWCVVICQYFSLKLLWWLITRLINELSMKEKWELEQWHILGRMLRETFNKIRSLWSLSLSEWLWKIYDLFC